MIVNYFHNLLARLRRDEGFIRVFLFLMVSNFTRPELPVKLIVQQSRYVQSSLQNLYYCIPFIPEKNNNKDIFYNVKYLRTSGAGIEKNQVLNRMIRLWDH